MGKSKNVTKFVNNAKAKLQHKVSQISRNRSGKFELQERLGQPDSGVRVPPPPAPPDGSTQLPYPTSTIKTFRQTRKKNLQSNKTKKGSKQDDSSYSSLLQQPDDINDIPSENRESQEKWNPKRVVQKSMRDSQTGARYVFYLPDRYFGLLIIIMKFYKYFGQSMVSH